MTPLDKVSAELAQARKAVELNQRALDHVSQMLDRVLQDVARLEAVTSEIQRTMEIDPDA